MKALLLTHEYPPYIYGGAGVHIDYLSRELAKIMEVEVRCFGDQEVDLPNLKVRGFGVNTAIFSCPKNLNSVFGAIRRCISTRLASMPTWSTVTLGIHILARF